MTSMTKIMLLWCQVKRYKSLWAASFRTYPIESFEKGARDELSRDTFAAAQSRSMESSLPTSHLLTDLRQIAKIQSGSIHPLLQSAISPESVETHCRERQTQAVIIFVSPTPVSDFTGSLLMRSSTTGLTTPRAASGNSNIPYELRFTQ